MPTERKIIALVEDDASVRRAIERQIRAIGYRCASFERAEEYLLVAADCGAACVICDVRLEGMSGLDLALHPRITELRIPVVLISGSDDPRMVEPARELGAAFLRKPFLCEELLEAIVGTVGAPIADSDG
jgi:two-component system, LuxR family, response regulator FixJ